MWRSVDWKTELVKKLNTDNFYTPDTPTIPGGNQSPLIRGVYCPSVAGDNFEATFFIVFKIYNFKVVLNFLLYKQLTSFFWK